MPYVDVRVDFNSWIPSNLNNKISEKLINFYLDKLKKYPQFHDKIEFEIAFTCFTFSIKERIDQLPKNKFSLKEKSAILNSLKKYQSLLLIKTSVKLLKN